MENPDTWDDIDRDVADIIADFDSSNVPGLSLIRRIGDYIRARDKALTDREAWLDKQLKPIHDPYELLMDLRMYMSVAEIKNPLFMIDDYIRTRGIQHHD